MPDYVTALKEKAENEPVARFLGMQLHELEEGYARVSTMIKPEHENFNGLVFGGIVMSLLDQVFAYATNSVFTPSVASQLNIHLFEAARIGQELNAEGRVVSSSENVLFTEMQVMHGETVLAKATGTAIPLV